ncbi:MAG: sarcosine oxidase subunit delta [Rhizobiaceae bacterium]|jgi:sarcosine oxidase subunit delta|nr:sarcosine oxidase subunit delta [Rhizobiaceae bacterium]
MLLIHCPYCGEERPEVEFRQSGEAHIARPQNMADITDEEFEAFFFLRDNPKGVTFERWRHVHGCARFFNAARDTVTDKILMTYKAGLPKPDITLPEKTLALTVDPGVSGRSLLPGDAK